MKIRKKPMIITLCSLVLCLSLVIGIAYRMPLTAHAVEVTAGISGMTRSGGGGVYQSSDNVYAFADGAQIQIVGWSGDWKDYNEPWKMALDTWWNSALSTYNATSDKWKTDNYMRWQNGDGLDHHFVSYWPANLVKPTENLTAVDVTVTGDYQKDDILLARWSGKHPEDNVLNLEFDHLLSRFDVHLYFRDEYAGATDISIETNLKNKAVADLLTGKVTATEGTGITMQSLDEPKSGYDWSGTCITVPHIFSSNEQLLTINFTVDGEKKSITYTHPTVLKFESGKRTTLNLTVGKDTKEAEVDLGLSVNWATVNVGATKPEEAGVFFAWGETEPKETFDWSSYRLCNGSANTMTKYCTNSSYGDKGFTDGKTILEAKEDAATVNMGVDWRMPTADEIAELLDENNCTWAWTTVNGVQGYTVTSKVPGYEGNSIFLPFTLYKACDNSTVWMSGYWSGSLSDENTGSCILFNSSFKTGGSTERACGLLIRPVREK